MGENKTKNCQILIRKLLRSHLDYHMANGVEIGVHPGQALMLDLLGDMNGCSQRELSEKLGVKAPTVAVNLRRMEKAGLVYKTAKKTDKRYNHVYLTELGREKAKKIKSLFEKEEKFLFGDYTDEEIAQIETFLNQLYEKTEEKLIEIENRKKG